MRIGLALAALATGFAAAPLAAQVAITPEPPAEGAVGPAQLRDFSLNGSVIRRAEPPPQQEQQQRTQAPAPVADPRVATRPAEPQAQPQRRAEAPAAAQPRSVPVPQAAATPAPQPASSAALPFGMGLDSPPTPARAETSAFAPAFAPAPADSAVELSPDGGGPWSWPWLLALAAAVGAAAWYFLRQRPRHAFAGGVSELVAPQPESRPAPAPKPEGLKPRQQPASAPAAVVSTRIRPWLDIRFAPDRLIFTDEGATLEFDVVVSNSGSAPARDVLVEAVMFTADWDQDKQIEAFFAHPAGNGERVASIAPLTNMALRSAVRLTREQLRLFPLNGRGVFVPLVGFNALYRTSAGDAQTSAAYVVGRDGKGEKMAPFRLDLGPRVFRGLGARELEQKVRR